MPVVTVLGPVDPSELGFTHPHEHLLCDIYEVTRNFDFLLNDEAIAVDELLAFKAAGGRSMVDVTNRGLGRQPEALARIARATGVHIVMGCGWYRQGNYDETVDRTRTDDLAADMVRDLTKGVGDTGIRAGIIGEIGVDKRYISAAEERVLRAAARAHKQTGAAITTHAIGHPLGLEQLQILREEGADLRRVIIGHCDTYLSPEYHEAVARQGAYVQYDTFGKHYVYPDERRLTVLVEMLSRGYASQILLSTDVAMRSVLHAWGGKGYDYLLVHIVPALKKAGVSDEQIHLMTVENPARVLPF